MDILAEKSGSELVRAIIHDILPGDIMDKYQSLTGQEYPTLQQFVDKARDVADRLQQKRRNRDNSDQQKQPKHVKEENTTTISPVGKQQKPPLKFRSKRPCLFCADAAHNSSRCPKFTTVEARIGKLRSLKGSEPCSKCLLDCTSKDTCKNTCKIAACKSPDTHGALACPMV